MSSFLFCGRFTVVLGVWIRISTFLFPYCDVHNVFIIKRYPVRLYFHLLYMRMSCQKYELFTPREHLDSFPSFWWVTHLFLFLCCFIFLCFRSVCSAECFRCLYIVHSWFPPFHTSVVFSGSSGNWNIVESGVKHHYTNKQTNPSVFAIVLFIDVICMFVSLTITRRVSLVEQEVAILPEYTSSPPVFYGARVAQYLAFCVKLSPLLFVRLSLLEKMYCQSLNLTSLESSIFSVISVTLLLM